MVNAAKIIITKEWLLKFLDFEGGEIHGVRFDSIDYWKPGVIEIIIEHPDLPSVNEGDVLRKVSPTYLAYGSRVSPEKK